MSTNRHFVIKIENKKQIVVHNDQKYIFKIPQKDQTLLYKCIHSSCSATLKLNKDKTLIVGGISTHARHSLSPSIQSSSIQSKSSVTQKSSKNSPLSSTARTSLNKNATNVTNATPTAPTSTTTVSIPSAPASTMSTPITSAPTESTPTKSTLTPPGSNQDDPNSSSSSSNFEFSTPIVQPPPRTLNDFITLSHMKGSDKPNQSHSPPSSPSSDLPGLPGTRRSTDDSSPSKDIQLKNRINELIKQRDSLTNQIKELSCKLGQCDDYVHVHADPPVSPPQRIAIFSDSMLRGVAELMYHRIATTSTTLNVSSLVKPSACFSQVTEGVATLCEDFGADDFIIIQAGTNDMTLLEPNCAKILPIKHFASLANKTNIILCSIPYRYDSLAYLSTNVYDTNTYLKYVCEKFNFTYLDTNAYLSRSHFTRHGLHYNRRGKRVLSEKILDLVSSSSFKNAKYNSTNPPLLKCTAQKPISTDAHSNSIFNSTCDITDNNMTHVPILRVNTQDDIMSIARRTRTPASSVSCQPQKPNAKHSSAVDVNLIHSFLSLENFPPLRKPWVTLP